MVQCELVNKEKVTDYLNQIIIGALMFMMFNSAVSIAGSSIGLGIAILSWFIKIIITKKVGLSQNPFRFSIIIFLGSLIISFIGSYDITKSIASLEDFLIPFIVFHIIIETISDLKIVDKLFKLGIISITIASLYGLIWQHYYLGVERVNAWFMALDFAALLLIYILFNFSFLLWGNEELYTKLKYGVLLLVILPTLIYSKTRGAWLGFVGSGSLFFWIKEKAWIPIFLIAVIIIVLFLPGNIQKRVKSIVDLRNNRSNLGRIALWKGAILMFRDHPINGIGLGNFSEVYRKFYLQPKTTSTAHAHNNFLNFLVETGLIGLLGFIYLLYCILKYLYKNYFIIKDSYYSSFVLASLGMVIGVFIIQGFTEYNFGKAVVGRSVWSLLGLTVVIINRLTKSKLDKGERV